MPRTVAVVVDPIQSVRGKVVINPLTSPREVVSVFISPYLSAGAPALGEAKGLMLLERMEVA